MEFNWIDFKMTKIELIKEYGVLLTELFHQNQSNSVKFIWKCQKSNEIDF